MRKVRDYYFKKAKKEKYPARSVFKLEEVQKKYRLFRRGDAVLDLGCYPGSWSLYTSSVVGPAGLVVGVDLQETSKEAREGGSPIHWICGDITDPELIGRIQAIRPAFKAVISDIAPKTTGNRWADTQHSMRLVIKTLELAQLFLHEKGHYLCKIFQGEGMPELVGDLKNRFNFVKVIKPQSSRKESREVFLLGMEFRR
ncbi:MAG: RlmE family RNA methyltransferase [Desulfofustis sp.]|nr:RlmE family RNA methyltransferase [Desulfofustis sp.]NNK58933.1 RlmE family RNA methyltransferase [Desulfofustis sp.]RZW15121.1 MAG: RlmE family RNA methyltransferase [Desulfobulbaceae bacterium]